MSNEERAQLGKRAVRPRAKKTRTCAAREMDELLRHPLKERSKIISAIHDVFASGADGGEVTTEKERYSRRRKGRSPREKGITRNPFDDRRDKFWRQFKPQLRNPEETRAHMGSGMHMPFLFYDENASEAPIFMKIGSDRCFHDGAQQQQGTL